jgi:hypothetical protein
MAELADAADSKSADRKVVGVRPPLPAPTILVIFSGFARIGAHVLKQLGFKIGYSAHPMYFQ